MFISLGLIGGLIYLYIVFAAFRRAFAYTQVVSLTVSLPVLAILVSTVATWMIGGQYSTSSTVCFLIGALAHEERSETSEISRASIYSPLKALEG